MRFPARLKKLDKVGLILLALAAVALACNFPGLAALPPPTSAPPETNGLIVKEIVNQVVTRQATGAPESPVVSGQVLAMGAVVETRGPSQAKLEPRAGGGLVRLLAYSRKRKAVMAA